VIASNNYRRPMNICRRACNEAGVDVTMVQRLEPRTIVRSGIR